MPVSTGMQLVGTTLFSVIFLGEWSSMTQIIFGFNRHDIISYWCSTYFT